MGINILAKTFSSEDNKDWELSKKVQSWYDEVTEHRFDASTVGAFDSGAFQVPNPQCVQNGGQEDIHFKNLTKGVGFFMACDIHQNLAKVMRFQEWYVLDYKFSNTLNKIFKINIFL